jgi:ribose 5-phosphate isomerase B
MRIAAGSDHAGFRLKTELVEHLRSNGHAVEDLGTDSTDRVDYPDFGAAVGLAVAEGTVELGLCVCGSGIGIAIAANKVPGVRAATCHDSTSGRLAREHNDANIICLGERLIGSQVAVDALDAFLAATFEGGRHTARVAKIDALLPDPIDTPTA